MTIPWPASAAALAAGVQRGDWSAVELCELALARIAAHEPELHAFVEVLHDRARQRAAAVDQARARGETLGAFAGVPIAFKDNLALQGEGTSAGSRILQGYRAPYTATALARLEAAGAVLIGRTNLDEFGMGSTTTSSCHGATHNPYDRRLVAGGSSGGSAVAVAADLCPLALGSDTGGSVRQPAAFCGISGLKPTWGRVSRSGLVAYASSLDCVGALARDVGDLALWLDVVGGPDPADTTTRPPLAAVAPACAARGDLRGLRIGVPWQLNGPGLDEEVAAATAQAARTAAQLGAELVECDLPGVEHAVPTYYLLATIEAASNLARYDGVRYGLRRESGGRLDSTVTQTRSAGFGLEVQLRILLGTFASSHEHSARYQACAAAARARLQAHFAALLQRCDVVLSPTSPVPPFAADAFPDDPLALYLCDALTVPASLCGLPALSIPGGRTAGGLPIGLQWTAAADREGLLLQLASVFQRHTDHHHHRPLP